MNNIEHIHSSELNPSSIPKIIIRVKDINNNQPKMITAINIIFSSSQCFSLLIKFLLGFFTSKKYRFAKYKT